MKRDKIPQLHVTSTEANMLSNILTLRCCSLDVINKVVAESMHYEANESFVNNVIVVASARALSRAKRSKQERLDRI